MAIGAFLAKAAVGMLSARQQQKAAEKNQQFQVDRQDLAYDRSLPWSNYGPAGNVEFDPETKKIMQTLSPEYQAQLQGFLGSSSAATAELQAIQGDPNAMAKQQFGLLSELSADAYNQSRLQGEEAAIAQGRVGTQGYYDKMAVEDSINQSILRDKISSVGLGMDYRKMVGQEALANNQAAMDITGMLRPDVAYGINAGSSATVDANMLGVSTAGSNTADTTSSFWSSLANQANKYDFNSLFPSGGTQPTGRTYSSILTDMSPTNASARASMGKGFLR